ncbi:MAG: Cell wall-associated [Rhodospirillaceae bacterium]|nr:MAG: Cell wall-associated [Rhodospirillaceae bacterium]TNC94855.1 MAG: Cell wall-associated hydrolase [Stygiobacter sp.]
MTEHIQINDVAPRVQYLADGIQSAFTFPFAIFKLADLEVWLDDVPQAGGYAVSGAGVSTGGVALFAVPPAADTRITLRRRLIIARTTDYQSDGLIRAKTLNDELDYQVAALQQVAEDVGRAVRRAPTALAVVDLTLPEPAAGRGLKWSPDGSRLINSANDPDAAGDVTLAASQTLLAADAAMAARDQAVAAAAGLSNPLSATANLSDLDDAQLARTNLGVPAIADMAVNARDEETVVALDDLALIHDTSAGADRKIAIANVLKAVDLLSTDASPDKAADYVMTWDASAGDVKKVLLSGVGGGAWEFVSAQTVSSSVASVDFTGFAAGYDYLVQFENLGFVTTNQVMEYQMRDSAGVLTGATYRQTRITVDGGTVTGSGAMAGTSVVMSPTLYVSAYGEIVIIDPQGDTTNRQTWFRCSGYGTAASSWTFSQGGGHYSQSIHTGLRLKTQSANITSGNCLLWRRKRSA